MNLRIKIMVRTEKLHPAPYISHLHNRVIKSDEIRLDPGTQRVVRRVRCEITHPDLDAYRNPLMTAGIVLGKEEGSTTRSHRYLVPAATRPLHLEVPSGSEDPASYRDADMIFDLGELSGIVARLCGNRIIVSPAEDAFGLVDYAHPGERQLFLLPGSEQLLSEPVAGDVMAEQMLQFSNEFGDNFGMHVGEFVEGFAEGIRGRL